MEHVATTLPQQEANLFRQVDEALRQHPIGQVLALTLSPHDLRVTEEAVLSDVLLHEVQTSSLDDAAPHAESRDQTPIQYIPSPRPDGTCGHLMY